MNTLKSTKARIALVILFAFATVTAGAGSLALLTDNANIVQKDTIATIDILANNTASYTVPERFWFGNGTEYTPVTIKNNGSSELRYAIVSTATDNSSLNQELQSTFRFGSTTSGCDAAGFSTFGQASSIIGATPDASDIGSPAAGAQAGDRVLAAGATEVLCMKLTLPLNFVSTGSLNWNMQLAAENTFGNP